MRGLFFLFTLLCFSGPSFASIFVGNGGEGVVLEGQVYLRDLYDNHIHLDAKVGPQINQEIQKRVKKSPVLKLGVSEDLLARKLTDLNYMSPRLGLYVLAAMDVYEWVFVDHQLAPIQGDGTPFSEIEYIPLANRYLNTIRLQRQSWEKVPPVHRVALVIHEVLYSLMEPICSADGLCSQSAAYTRELVAWSFSRYGGLPFMSEMKESWLSLPPANDRRICPHRGPLIDQHDASDWKARESQVKELCKVSSGKKYVRLLRDPFQLVERSYKAWRAPNSFPLEQIHLRIVMVPGYRILEIGPRSSSHPQVCEARLHAEIASWFNYAPETLLPDPIVSCLSK